MEIVPNTPGGPLVVYKLMTDVADRGCAEFEAHTIDNGAQGHALGFGDITGNGRGDFVLRHGWLEAPGSAFDGDWIFHPDFDLGSASIPILVVDVNGNGVSDLLVGQGNDPIDPYNSQYHDLHWVDLDGDGVCELVTGKRYRAHNGRDPGADDDVGLYYF
jgi:hypothetical protein